MNNKPMELTFSDGTRYELVPKKRDTELMPGEKYRLTRDSYAISCGTIVTFERSHGGDADVLIGEGFKFNDGTPIRPDGHYIVERSALEPLPEEPKELWEPEKNKEHCYIYSSLSVEQIQNDSVFYDAVRIASFNCFEPGIGNAERLAPKLKAFTYLWRVATGLYGGTQKWKDGDNWTPDFMMLEFDVIRFDTKAQCDAFEAHASNGTSTAEQFGILFGTGE